MTVRTYAWCCARLCRVFGCSFQMSGRALSVRLDAGPQEATGEMAAKRAAPDMSAYGVAGGMGGMAGRLCWRRVCAGSSALHCVASL